MPKILLSYRRADSEAITGRIHDRLALYFGSKSVFQDIDQIPLGVDFREFLKTEIPKYEIVLAIVGPNWHGPGNGASPRIFEKTDPVRAEIETAIRTERRTIPVLVNGATMPKAPELPPSLEVFSYMNAAVVASGVDFHSHMARLIRSLNAPQGPAKWRTTIGGLARAVKSRTGLVGLTASVCVGLAGGTYLSWDRLFPPPKSSAVFLLPPGEGISPDDKVLKERAFKQIWAHFLDGLSHQSKYAVIPSNDELNDVPSTFRKDFLGQPGAPWVIVSTKLAEYGNRFRRRIEFLARPSIFFQDNNMSVVIELGTFDAESREFHVIDDARVEVSAPRARADFLALLASYRLIRNLFSNAGLRGPMEQIVAQQFISGLRTQAAGLQSPPAPPQNCQTFECVDSFGERILASINPSNRSGDAQVARNTAAERTRLDVGQVE